ncbi:hypothetical protein B0H11DRAFT_2264210 [Mycena galericulata]|nr:hypothetical protein B0H11DRAFT_2264210 [Mycena galericulata]
MLSVFFVLATSAALVHSKSDPCALTTASTWVSSQMAHACELNVPFNKTRSLAIIDSNIKALPWYSLGNWFLNSLNPLIPDNSESFSIATLATKPSSAIAYPTFLVDYDFPNQGCAGLGAYFQSINIAVHQYNGARILAINGVDASTYLVDLATTSSIYDGLVGAYETVNPRYMHLMSCYSAGTASGAFTQEAGRFSQRAFYPGTNGAPRDGEGAQVAHGPVGGDVRGLGEYDGVVHRGDVPAVAVAREQARGGRPGI